MNTRQHDQQADVSTVRRTLGAALGACSLAWFILVLVVCFGLFVPFALGKLLIPIPAARRAMTGMMERVGRGPWWLGNRIGFLLTLGCRRALVIDGSLDARHSWLLLGNHRSWVDIPLLFDVLGQRMAFPRFFVKEELRWMPVIGFCCWALDMPFMRRHTRAELATNPAAGRDDMEATRRACARFRDHPVTLVNFAEGTRYTEAKHAAQRSPFRHLLKPKSGGVAFAMEAMGDQFAGIIDVTFIYRRTRRGALWGFLCGDQHGMQVHVDVRPVPAALVQRGALSQAAYRARCREWIDALWAAKDARIDRALQEDRDAGR